MCFEAPKRAGNYSAYLSWEVLGWGAVEAIRETRGFRLICNLRRSARGGEWRFCRPIRRIERPAKSKNREGRKHGGNAAMNDVSSDSVSCSYGGSFLSSFFFGIFGQGWQNLWEIRKRSVHLTLAVQKLSRRSRGTTNHPHGAL